MRSARKEPVFKTGLRYLNWSPKWGYNRSLNHETKKTNKKEANEVLTQNEWKPKPTWVGGFVHRKWTKANHQCWPRSSTYPPRPPLRLGLMLHFQPYPPAQWLITSLTRTPSRSIRIYKTCLDHKDSPQKSWFPWPLFISGRSWYTQRERERKRPWNSANECAIFVGFSCLGGLSEYHPNHRGPSWLML